MNYKIELSKRSFKYLDKLDQKTKKRIADHLQILSQNPRSTELDIKKIQGEASLYRLRIGSYRILYTIKDNQLIIIVINIGPRGDVYNDL
ncbi:addiction module RelE/StbE family toxin [Paenibacillus cellulosilyticus]|uniref:Addiction module RelE/StbE family toxin n=2 Tax=Paenibacillus cellulosilyticus TaxID=375489 RepID=A0A2V2Y8D2_9BACL|nr:addiction module RelE/StbE family toxin [Paenibacillus cellulosilyticus]QKS44946.1 type II toxin-antitoxin system RelE/ParE family toxin [Paenibacillus cellulosilyticus]